MENQVTDSLAVFNQLYKKMDGIYHLYAKRMGLSDMALWLLYSLCESNAAYTQRELCSGWLYPPQTVNSALKGLEKKEIIALEPVPGNKKNKQIVLTEKGKEFTQKMIAPLILAEKKTFQGMKEEERKALLDLTRNYVGLLQENINRI